MGHDNAGNDLMGSPQILNKVNNELGGSRHHDDAGGEDPSSNMVGNAGANRMLIRRVGTVVR